MDDELATREMRDSIMVDLPPSLLVHRVDRVRDTVRCVPYPRVWPSRRGKTWESSCRFETWLVRGLR